MKSPYTQGFGPYQDSQSNRTIFAEEEKLITAGYKFLGWNYTWENQTPPEYRHCVNEAHNYYSSFPNVWKSVQHTPSGSDVTQWCTKCKIYWKVDMSD